MENTMMTNYMILGITLLISGIGAALIPHIFKNK